MTQSSPITPDDNQKVQGLSPPLTTPAQRALAMEQAFDYRGDVTIRTTDGRVVEGYVFDRRRDTAQAFVRIIPKDGSARVTVRDDQVAAIIFSGRDPAAGKSWESWVAKYNDKKARGENATIEPQPLD
jgi:hypothetical protein